MSPVVSVVKEQISFKNTHLCKCWAGTLDTVPALGQRWPSESGCKDSIHFLLVHHGTLHISPQSIQKMLSLGQHRRRWANFNSTLGQRWVSFLLCQLPRQSITQTPIITRDVDPMLNSCWPSVVDGGPT